MMLYGGLKKILFIKIGLHHLKDYKHMKNQKKRLNQKECSSLKDVIYIKLNILR